MSNPYFDFENPELFGERPDIDSLVYPGNPALAEVSDVPYKSEYQYKLEVLYQMVELLGKAALEGQITPAEEEEAIEGLYGWIEE